MTATSETPALDYPARRAELLESSGATGTSLCIALADLADAWLAELFERAGGQADGMALVAVGGYGRGGLFPESDLDLLLLHAPRVDAARVADGIWYPVWDTGTKLGHAVRTVKESLKLASHDLDTATSLLAVRHLAGDPHLTGELASSARQQWRKRSRQHLARLADSVDQRHARFGEVAFLLEPDVKEGRGGLRDVQALGWVAESGLLTLPDTPSTLAEVAEVLVEVRVALHLSTGRADDRLLLQDQDAVASAVGCRHADELMQRLATAARAVAWASDESWERVRSAIAGPLGRSARRDRPLAPGVLLRDGRVALAPDSDPGQDPGVVLRAAVEAARAEAPLDRASLALMAETTPYLDGSWPDGARRDLVALLGTGHAAIPVWEALDRHDLITRLIPEWAAVRSKPQRNAYHRFTVDRHLCEAAANAAPLATDVARGDLLLVGTWLHDIGKGYPGDHTEVGMDLVERIAPRLGFDHADTATLMAMVQHHLLLPDVATRRDLDDDATIATVADAIGDPHTLELLAAQTVADSLATGPSAWSRWKAGLVDRLVSRVAHVLSGGQPADVTADVDRLDPDLAAAADRGEQVVRGSDDRLVVVTADRPGVFAKVAGAVALSGLTVLAATAASRSGCAVSSFVVEPERSEGIDWPRVVAQVERALAGRLSIDARLAERARAYHRPLHPDEVPPPRVIVDNHITDAATVLEVRAPDSTGLLYRVTRALADLHLDISSARVQTLGATVVDAFYVTDEDGKPITDEAHLDEVRAALLHAAEPSP